MFAKAVAWFKQGGATRAFILGAVLGAGAAYLVF